MFGGRDFCPEPASVPLLLGTGADEAQTHNKCQGEDETLLYEPFLKCRLWDRPCINTHSFI